MELLKLIVLIVCSALLLLIVLPAIAVFFIFQAKDLHGSARWAKTVVIIFIILGVVLLGVIVWDAVDMFLPKPTVQLPDAADETPTQTSTLPPETSEATENVSIIGATISTEQLDGQWIAISEPWIPEDENYSYAANGGYYMFSLNGTFTYTQVYLTKAGTWKAMPGDISYTGIYVLEGDFLTLHYESCTEQTYDAQTDTMIINESALDETETISMLINQSCTEMCVLAPDHPKLGKLFIFQKGRGSDPINALLIALNASY